MTIQFTAPVLWIAINCMYRQMYLHVNFICALIMSTALLKAYCTPLYTSHMWCSHSKGKMDKLKVAYNEALRILLKYPRWESASKLYVNCNDPTFHRSTFFFAHLHKVKFNARPLQRAAISRLLASLPTIPCTKPWWVLYKVSGRHRGL